MARMRLQVPLLLFCVAVVAVIVQGENTGGNGAGDGLGNASLVQSVWGWGGCSTTSPDMHFIAANICDRQGFADTSVEAATPRKVRNLYSSPPMRSKTARAEISRLLSVPSDTFISSLYESRPVVRLRNNDTFFQSLRSLASPRFLARLELVKASKNGHITARKAEVAHLEGRPRDLGVPRESVEVVATRLRDGESIVANEVQELHSHLANISRDIGRLTGVTVNANMYLTPAGRTGFTPHWDWTDSLVLHVSGRKLWKVCNGEALGFSPGLPNRAEDLPTSPFHNQIALERLVAAEQEYRQLASSAERTARHSHTSVAIVRDDSGAESPVAGGWPCTDVLLTPGSVLYMPRGTVHAPRALGVDEEVPRDVVVALESETEVIAAAAATDAAAASGDGDSDMGVVGVGAGESFHITLGLPARQFTWFDALQCAADTVETAASNIAKALVSRMLDASGGGPGVQIAKDAMPHSITMARLTYEVFKELETQVPWLRRRFPVWGLRRESGANAWDGSAMQPGRKPPKTFILGRQRYKVWAFIRSELADVLEQLLHVGPSERGAFGPMERSVAAVCGLSLDASDEKARSQAREGVLAVMRLFKLYLGPLVRSAKEVHWRTKWPPAPMDAAVRDIVDLMLSKSQKLREVRKKISQKGLLEFAEDKH